MCTAHCIVKAARLFHIEDPTEPKELLTLANTWMKAMFDDPKDTPDPTCGRSHPPALQRSLPPIRLTLSMLMMCLYSVRKNAPHCWTNLINSTGGSTPGEV